MFKTGIAVKYARKTLAKIKGPIKGQIFSTSNREFSVDKLFELADLLPTEEDETVKYKPQLMDFVWSNEDDEEIRPVDIKPGDEHWKRMMESDLSYPILISPDGDIMDGYHRLLKAILAGRNKIKVKKFRDWPEDAELE